jgi:fumarate reductase flavoprotein subunit
MNTKTQLTTRMVVVGGGGAGMAAAVTAGELGVKNIIVLEKRGATGGTSAMASGIFGAESPAQRRQAILAPKEEMFKRAMAWSQMKADPRIVRAFIDRSADTIAWLEDKGVYFYCVAHSPSDNPRTWHVPKGNGAEILQALADAGKELGIEVIVEATAKQLLHDDDGQVTGVRFEHEGATKEVLADAVLISSGGFAGDKRRMKKYCPGYRPEMIVGGRANAGEGIFMALESGATPDGLGYLMTGGPLAAGLLHLGPDKLRVSLGFISGEPFAVWVNRHGRRFIDETESYNYYRCINALVRQPGAMCYALLDTAMIQRISESGLTNVAEGYGYGTNQRSRLPAGLAEAIRKEAKKGRCLVSGDWDEITRWMGMTGEVLRRTVEEYNDHCDHGYDPVFGKDRRHLLPLRTPPYFALACYGTILNTMGGIKVNEHMEVLNEDDAPIPGLYAAGVDTGGWTGDTYCADLPGTAFGYAINSGCIAGESIAHYLGSRTS